MLLHILHLDGDLVNLAVELRFVGAVADAQSHRRLVVEADIGVSSAENIMPCVCSILPSATCLPLTESFARPPLPLPPPSYLKSNVTIPFGISVVIFILGGSAPAVF